MGIGGKTIEEAKQKMTYCEFSQWVIFREKYGPLNILHRIDYGFARLISAQVGGKVDKHMPYLPKNNKSGEENLLNNFEKLGTVIKNGKNVDTEKRKMKIANKKENVLKLEERVLRLKKNGI